MEPQVMEMGKGGRAAHLPIGKGIENSMVCWEMLCKPLSRKPKPLFVVE